MTEMTTAHVLFTDHGGSAPKQQFFTTPNLTVHEQGGSMKPPSPRWPTG